MISMCLMKKKTLNYKKIKSKKEYSKTCHCCKKTFTTKRKNKRYCDECRNAREQYNNKERVKQYQKKYGRNTIGTSNLTGEIKEPFEEIDLIINEMYHLNLL